MTEPRWLSRTELAAWMSFLHAGTLLNRRIDHQLKKDSDLSHVQYAVLARLVEQPAGELRMSQLAGTLNTSKSGLTYQIGRLEKEGLVARKPDQDDVRGVIAVITDEGRKRQAQAAPGHVAVVREHLIDVLSPEQLALLTDGLGEVCRKLRATEESGGWGVPPAVSG
ncbi:MAG TPA: MarR family winged helix-turn-helix transcriptional regulator [Pseudonocardiaceae bacterium]|nr:MarR family winged helix-turn-helix transcriptional regulator [Pseudonocardiaceae bacterium]